MNYGENIENLEWLGPNLIIYQGYKVKLTPMIEQYLEAKKQNPSMMLLFRMGDFFETFFDDAKIISKVCGLTLTSRNKTEDGGDLPMAGVPYRNINEYLFQLVEQGIKVAVCDQLEDPSQAVGIVRRGITQIVTPGTLTDDRPGFDKNARFLTSLIWIEKKGKAAKTSDDSMNCFMASIDLATGYCTVTEVSSISSLQSELLRINVREVVTHHSPADEALERILRGIAVTYRDRADFSQNKLLDSWICASDPSNDAGKTPFFMSKEKFLSFIDLIDQAQFNHPQGVIDAFCGLLFYLRGLHYPLTDNIEQIYPYRAEAFMQIDAATFQNLEIYATLRGGQKTGSLLGELDDTITGPGSRLLQNWLAYPLKNTEQINERLDAVEDLVNHCEVRDKIRIILRDTCDLERIAAKIANDKIVPRELNILRQTLRVFPDIIECCTACCADSLRRAAQRLTKLDALADTIGKALTDDAPSNLNDTNFFRPGYDEKLDRYREITENGQQWLLDYEAKLRQETGISSLKVKYQNIFGYFIEVTNANRSLVPDKWIRSQTLKNSERFYTPELKEYEEEQLNANARRSERELELYADLKKFAAAHLASLISNARILAIIDVIASLANTAHYRQYTRPILNDSKIFQLKNARHPVVERFLPKGERFVPNDIKLDENGRLMLITGPNMAGKSTVIRQAAIITLMAQMGSFVPAESAAIGVVDRIFSRVGASDNLALGQSTFMVEMTETANILKNATDHSLVILDEIGRGTSTYDGLSLAWAITEYLHTKIGARTLFATHYHELTELANILPGIVNTSIAVKEYKNDIIFLRRLIDGAASRSYGIQVARLAGIPDEVIHRANDILETLESNAHRELASESSSASSSSNESAKPQAVSSAASNKPAQLSLFDNFCESSAATVQIADTRFEELARELTSHQLDAMTPIQALNWMYKWQKKLRRMME